MRSSRLPLDLTPSPLAAAVARARAQGRPLIDLTLSNPTRAGLPYPLDLLTPLADPAGLSYEPEPLGLLSARRAVADDYARRGVVVGPQRLCLTASTSEAYALLFKLLCDAGDTVLVPRPSYPLFEHLTALECVRAVPYDLELYGAWRLDVAAIARSIDDRTRAVLVVSPNNPTGSVVQVGELEALAALCGERGIALIGDEVFADYRLDGAGPSPSVLQQAHALAFSLGGLSKSVGLPQVKVAWIGVSGPDAAVDDALAGLELVADTFLSVSTPAQVALPRLLTHGASVRAAIRERTARNLAALHRVVPAVPAVTLLTPAGGWCAVLQVPAMLGEEALLMTLLERDGVLVQPGYFFDFPREAFVVVSLLVGPEEFDVGVARLLARVTEVA
ncbi:MAG: pyridoxal phosphate-dependent aminotransferase [Acidobacteriota bacterium]